MAYSDLLRHPYWQKKSADIKNRDGWKCRRCSDPFTQLHVHHLYYKPNTHPWDYPDNALITLCSLCHRKAEFEKWFLVSGLITLSQLQLSPIEVEEVKEIVLRRLDQNKNAETADRYMIDIKRLLHG